MKKKIQKKDKINNYYIKHKTKLLKNQMRENKNLNKLKSIKPHEIQAVKGILSSSVVPGPHGKQDLETDGENVPSGQAVQGCDTWPENVPARHANLICEKSKKKKKRKGKKEWKKKRKTLNLKMFK